MKFLGLSVGSEEDSVVPIKVTFCEGYWVLVRQEIPDDASHFSELQQKSVSQGVVHYNYYNYKSIDRDTALWLSNIKLIEHK